MKTAESDLYIFFTTILNNEMGVPYIHTLLLYISSTRSVHREAFPLCCRVRPQTKALKRSDVGGMQTTRADQRGAEDEWISICKG